MLIAACYGVYDETYLIRGTVRLDGAGVEGVQVCADAQGVLTCTLTDYTGYFSMETTNTQYFDNGFEICVSDVDGTDHGAIVGECLTIPAGQDDPVNVEFNVQEK